MRVPVLALTAAVAAATATAPGYAATPFPTRKDGLWEMIMKSSGIVPVNMTMRQCTDPAEERNGAALRDGGGPPQGTPGAECKPGPVLPSPGGWSFSNTCTIKGGMTMATSGVARGDFNSGYHIDTTTRMTPAPIPQMAETKMTIDAKWLGPCPADMKPGDTIVNGRKISRPAPRG